MPGPILQPKVRITIEIDTLTGGMSCDTSQPVPLDMMALVFAKVLVAMSDSAAARPVPPTPQPIGFQS